MERERERWSEKEKDGAREMDKMRVREGREREKDGARDRGSEREKDGAREERERWRERMQEKGILGNEAQIKK